MEDDVKQSGADRYAVSQAYRWKAERDKAMQELRQLKDSSRDTTVSAYDLLPEEDRETLRWVREQGGLDSVKKLLDWVVGHCSTKQQLDFDFWLSGRVMYELGFDDDMADRDEVERRLLARLMPEGYEWPRYEDGKTVAFRDKGLDVHGHARSVEGVKFTQGGFVFISDDMGNTWWANDRGPMEDPEIDPDKRVKRPAVSAADGDGCCEPGTYRCQEVAFTCDSCGHTVFVDKCMVDEIRYLRAKGIRTLNCCCGHGEKVEPFIIVNEGDECRMLNMGYERRVNKYGVTYFTPKSACPPKFIAVDGKPLLNGETVWEVETGDVYVVERIYSGTTEPDFPGHTVACHRPDDIVTHMFKPSQLTHRAPVLAADGRPLREGDEVWRVKDGSGPYHVQEIRHGASVCVGETWLAFRPKELTHERPDSYDALWEDIEECAVGYSEFMRRVKALAGGA